MRYLLLSVIVVSLIGLFITPSAIAIQDSGDFELVYVQSDKYTDYEKWVKSWLGENQVDWLNQNFKLPNNITILVGECGVSNAWYAPVDLEIVMCYELIEEFNQYFNDQYSGKVSNFRIDEAVMNAVNFVFFHEVGHALIDVHNIPATGSQEDAVDQFSAYTLMKFSNLGPQTVYDASDVFLYWHSTKGFSQNSFADTHSLDIQRFYDLNCYVYGSDVIGKEIIVESGYLPIERAVNCTYEYNKIINSWDILLDSIMVNSPSQLSLIATPSLNPASDIFIKTDQDKYSKGDVITISGSVKYHDPSVSNAITVIIKNQSGDSVARLQLGPDDASNTSWVHANLLIQHGAFYECKYDKDGCVQIEPKGKFSATMPVLGKISKAGEYEIIVTWNPVFRVNDVYAYGTEQRSITSFEVVSSSAATSEQQTQPEPVSKPVVTQKSIQKVPDWVRNIFIWYAEEQISEDELLNAIKFLVNQRIINLNQ